MKFKIDLVRKCSGKYNSSVPVVLYKDTLLEKNNIFRENKDKILVYRWVNNINNKTYVGSTVNFYSRFYKYYNTDYLKKHSTPLHDALLKHDYSNFTLEILEYCNKNNVTEREQHYMDLLKPDYNILQTAGLSLGFKHNQDTLDYFKNVRKLSSQARNKLSLAASNRILTKTEKAKLSKIRKGIKLSEETREKISNTITSLIGVSVLVKDTVNNTEKIYSSMTEAANVIGVSRTAIKKACVSGNLLKKRYYIETENK